MRRWTWCLLIATMWLLVACGGQSSAPGNATPSSETSSDSSASPTATILAPTETPSPTATPAPTATATPGETTTTLPAFRLPEDVADIQDARLHYVVRVRAEEGDISTIEEDTALVEWTMELTREPPARHIIMEGALAALGAGVTGNEAPQVELIQIESDTWVRMGDQWILVAQQEAPSVEDDLGNILQMVSLGALEAEGRETVNGFETVHYHAEWNAAVLGEPMTLGFLGAFVEALGGDVQVQPEQVVLDVYATEDGLIVKSVYQIHHQVSQGDQSASLVEEILFEVQAVNTGITIEPPSEAEVPETSVPLPEGATLQSAFAGTLVYGVPGATLDDVVAFYDEALPQNGFTVIQRAIMAGQGGFIQAEKDGTVYQIVIGADAEGNASITILTLE